MIHGPGSNGRPAYAVVLDSPVGRLGIRLQGAAVSAIDFLADDIALMQPRTQAAGRVAGALQRYFSTPGQRLDLPVQAQGTPFQRRVWRALQDIPPGQTRSYGELAARLGSGARAVGNACRRNPVPLIVPCHRVVGAHGPGGFSGQTGGAALQRKLWLLAHEGIMPGDLKTNRSAPMQREQPANARSSQA